MEFGFQFACLQEASNNQLQSGLVQKIQAHCKQATIPKSEITSKQAHNELCANLLHTKCIPPFFRVKLCNGLKINFLNILFCYFDPFYFAQ